MTKTDEEMERLLEAKHAALDNVQRRVDAIRRIVQIVETAHSAVMSSSNEDEVADALRSMRYGLAVTDVDD